MNESRDAFEDRQAALRAALLALPTSQDRLSWVVREAQGRAPFPPEARVDRHLVKGCAARLWLVGRIEDGRCRFACDSESAILKAVAGLLCALYDGLPPAEVAQHEPEFLNATGLLHPLTENRRRTIARVRDVLRAFAHAPG